jgi:ABC-type antimicrobial peptide transport system permease subunit
VIIRGLRGPIALGVVLASAGSLVWDGTFSSGIAGVYASTPVMLLKCAAWIVACVLLACVLPLRRATATDPVAALRDE